MGKLTRQERRDIDKWRERLQIVLFLLIWFGMLIIGGMIDNGSIW